MKIIFSAALAALAAGAFFSPVAHAQSYKLRYSPKQGENFTFNSAMDMQQSMSAMGQDYRINVNMNMDMMLDVADIVAEKHIVNMSFKNAELAINVNGLEAMGGNDTIVDLNKMLDYMKLTYSVDEFGKTRLADRSGFSNSSDPMIKQVGSGVSHLTGSVSFEYPEKELTAGDTWTVTKNDTNATKEGSIITSSVVTYTFDGTVDTLGVKCARIFAKSSSMAMEGMFNQQGTEIYVEGDGALKGLHYVELANGIPVATTSSTQMDMRTRVSGQESMIMPMQSDMKVAITRK